MIGPFFRPGHTYNTEAITVFDHDWPSLADGVAIPHGLYDLTQNQGFLQIGTSRDTSEFACDSVHHWWTHHGRQQYLNATALLLLCDCGGSNSARYYIFKQDLQALATGLGIEIRIAHYPPYTSKYNPIEHRLFPHVSWACRGVIFDTLETVRDVMAKAATKTGLTVVTDIIDKVYHKGRTATNEFKQEMPIHFDEYLPQWNYVARPQPT